MIGQKDVRSLTPEYVASMLPTAQDMKPGCFLFQSTLRRAHRRRGGGGNLLDLYADMGRALARFTGWRAACFVANPRFVEAFGHFPAMTKPATNAELSGAFLVYNL